jgi:hypothetical protein
VELKSTDCSLALRFPAWLTDGNKAIAPMIKATILMDFMIVVPVLWVR